MSPVEEFAFLDPWHQVIPGRGVVAIAGSGGCTTLLIALTEILRQRGQTLLVSQTTAHPVPLALQAGVVSADADAVRARVLSEGWAVVVGDADAGRHAGIDPAELDRLWRGSGADLLLVQAQAPSGQLLRTRAVPPVWPRSMQLALLVAQVGLAGALWSGATGETPADPARRVAVSDLVESLRPLLKQVPEGVRPLPFLTGMGLWRDLDGMFAIVQEFWEDPRVWVVALGELLGNERRDQADLRDLPERVPNPLDHDRVYAVYPAALDE